MDEEDARAQVVIGKLSFRSAPWSYPKEKLAIAPKKQSGFGASQCVDWNQPDGQASQSFSVLGLMFSGRLGCLSLKTLCLLEAYFCP